MGSLSNTAQKGWLQHVALPQAPAQEQVFALVLPEQPCAVQLLAIFNRALGSMDSFLESVMQKQSLKVLQGCLHAN